MQRTYIGKLCGILVATVSEIKLPTAQEFDEDYLNYEQIHFILYFFSRPSRAKRNAGKSLLLLI